MMYPPTSISYFRAGGTPNYCSALALIEQINSCPVEEHRLVLADHPTAAAATIAGALTIPNVTVDGAGLWLCGLATALHNALAAFTGAPERSMPDAMAFDAQRVLARETTTLDYRVLRLVREAFAAARALAEDLRPAQRSGAAFTVLLHSVHPLAAQRLVGWRDQLWGFQPAQLIMIACPEDRDWYLSGSGDSWCYDGGIRQIR